MYRQYKRKNLNYWVTMVACLDTTYGQLLLNHSPKSTASDGTPLPVYEIAYHCSSQQPRVHLTISSLHPWSKLLSCCYELATVFRSVYISLGTCIDRKRTWEGGIQAWRSSPIAHCQLYPHFCLMSHETYLFVNVKLAEDLSGVQKMLIIYDSITALD